jgi:hypothetical protein
MDSSLKSTYIFRRWDTYLNDHFLCVTTCKDVIFCCFNFFEFIPYIISFVAMCVRVLLLFTALIMPTCTAQVTVVFPQL